MDIKGLTPATVNLVFEAYTFAAFLRDRDDLEQIFAAAIALRDERPDASGADILAACRQMARDRGFAMLERTGDGS